MKKNKIVLIFVLLWSGCSTLNLQNYEEIYEVSWLYDFYLKGYRLIEVKSLKTNDTSYIVSKISLDNIDRTKIKIERGTIFTSKLIPFDSGFILNKSEMNYNLLNWVYSNGKLLIKNDTLVVSTFISNDILDLKINKDCVVEE